jgi:2,4-diketo-3-deoxy-L-fuconate hydrolase
MKLVRYGKPGKEKPGLIDSDGRLRDLSAVVADIGPDQLSDAALARLRKLKTDTLPLVKGSPRMGCPVAGIGKFIAIGLNYADHAAEAGMPIPAEPIVFMKATSCIQGPDDPVMLPKGSKKSDWEVELGVVIGRQARHVSQKDGLSACGRLLRRQRRQRTSLPDRARRHLGQGKRLRHLRPHRPLAGDAG